MRSVFDEMMSRYEDGSTEDYSNALHEVMQQVALAGLYRGGFFDKAAFYGGTCLRIFYDLQRFSEDLDFSLLQPDSTFNLENYFDNIVTEFKALGRDVIIMKKEKTQPTNIESAFLKDDTAIYDLKFKTEQRIKIKIEVDVDPPGGFGTEHKLLLLPFSFMARCYTLPHLFAGKMHALLFRSWKNRVKGRDWYDFEWYVRNGVALNFDHFRQRCLQFGWNHETELNPDAFMGLLKEKINQANIKMMKTDVKPFLRDKSEIDIWSTDYFMQLTGFLKIDS